MSQSNSLDAVVIDANVLYIALAEGLSQNGNVELLTFDAGMVNQVAKHASSVRVNLLPV